MCVMSTYRWTVGARGLGRVVTREGACVREREGARINAMHVSVNHYPTNVRHKPFPDERRKNR